MHIDISTKINTAGGIFFEYCAEFEDIFKTVLAAIGASQFYSIDAAQVLIKKRKIVV
jgi:hypothetical protein